MSNNPDKMETTIPDRHQAAQFKAGSDRPATLTIKDHHGTVLLMHYLIPGHLTTFGDTLAWLADNQYPLTATVQAIPQPATPPATPEGLPAFLRARLDEDEQAAKLAGAGSWHVECGYTPGDCATDCGCGHRRIEGNGNPGITIYDEGGHDEDQANHIVRHDPAHVLADIDAKRRIIDHVANELADHGADNPWWYEGKIRPILECLALPYTSHPDHQQEWKP